jgi:hypothetical protein
VACGYPLLLTEESFTALAERAREHVVSRIDCAVYNSSDRQISKMFELQIWFGDAVERFRVAGNGENIESSSTPLADTLVTVTDDGDYIALVDVSNRAEYRPIVGTTFNRLVPLSNRFGTLSGVTFESDDACKMNVYVEADELCITFGDSIPRW